MLVIALSPFILALIVTLATAGWLLMNHGDEPGGYVFRDTWQMVAVSEFYRAADEPVRKFLADRGWPA
jgi:hypothetical protein